MRSNNLRNIIKRNKNLNMFTEYKYEPMQIIKHYCNENNFKQHHIVAQTIKLTKINFYAEKSLTNRETYLNTCTECNNKTKQYFVHSKYYQTMKIYINHKLNNT